MQLRIYRTWKWVAAFEPMIGQKVPLRLQSCEELQYRNHKNEWLPLPVEEAEKPEHPDEIESRRQSEEMQAEVDRLIADGSIKFPNVQLVGRPGGDADGEPRSAASRPSPRSDG